MYFTIINGLLLAFFLFLILIGIKLKFWAFLPINIVGIIVVTISLYLDLNNLLKPINIIVLLAALLIIFITDIIFTFRDFREEVTEIEAKRLRKYLNEGISNGHFKLIGDEQLLKTEIERHKNIATQERQQALEMFKMGNREYVKGEYKEALEKYDLSTSWVETSIGFLNQSGILLQLGQYEDALVTAEKAAKIQSNFYEALLNQGVALEKMKKYDKALEKYKTAASISPDEYEVWFCCANILFKINKPEEAIECYDKSINLYGRLYEAWYYKGVCLQKIGQDVEALRCFEQVIKLNSNYSHAYYRSGNILTKLERNNEAIQAYEKTIKINPEFITAWNNLGVVLAKIGRVKDAIKCYERAVKINPEYCEAWLNMGLAQDNLGWHKKAYVSYCKFLEVATSDMDKQISITRKRVDEFKTRYKLRPAKIQKKETRKKKITKKEAQLAQKKSSKKS
jgi:tetratricopeptide (TPR) repeat protein